VRDLRDLKKAVVVYTVNLKEFQGDPKLPTEIKDFADVILVGDTENRPLPKGVEYTINLELG
jgi:hypothetical protein